MMLSINLSLEETNLVLAVLADQPFKTVARVITNIKSQADEQAAAFARGPQAVREDNA